MRPNDGQWWRSGVLYQVYPRSFADSNGDGVGDLRGVIDHLDYLAWLGVDGIWLSPITVSPNVDWGYDVADYCDVQREYGTLADVDELVAEAGHREMRVLLDLVPNHTSDQHPWFADSRTSRAARHRDWYVWADGEAGGSPPNNWVSGFGGPAWTLDDATGQHYLHNFAPEQPDLNWWNGEVREAFDEIQRFWYDRGVAGFRIDVCHMIVKDAELRDNPASTDDDHRMARLLGQRPVHNSNRPEVHEVLRRWRRLADSYRPSRVLVGETVVYDLEELVRFYGTGADELDLAFNVPFLGARLDAQRLSGIVERTEALLPPGAWPVWAASNHDVSRMASHEHERRLLHRLRGSGAAAHVAGHSCALPGRRDRASRHPVGTDRHRRPGRVARLAAASGSGPGPDADALDRPPRGGIHGAWREAVASVGRRRRRQRRGSAVR